MKLLMNRAFWFFVLVLMIGPVRAQTMIGATSDSVAVDTTPGEVLTAESGWYKDNSRNIKLRLSTRWDEAEQGVLTINGNEYTTLSTNSETYLSVSLPANSAGTYECQWTVGDKVYSRTIVTEGARTMAFSALMEFDNALVRKPTAAGEQLSYDISWVDGATTAVIACNDAEITQGILGSYDWVPGPTYCKNVLTLSLRDASGEEIAQEQAIFVVDAERAEIDADIPWTLGSFDDFEKVTDVTLETMPAIASTQWIAGGTTNGATIYRSNPVNNYESTVIEFIIPKGQTQLEFLWKLDSENSRAIVQWYLDGVWQGAISSYSSQKDWQTVTRELDGASHVLMFYYSKVNGAQGEVDCGSVAVGNGLQPVVRLKDVFPESYAQVTNVVLGAEVTAVPDGFFDGCTALQNITFPESITDFGESDWRALGTQLGKAGLWVENDWVLGYLGTAPESLVIPEGVTSIAASAFEGQSALASLSVPANLTAVGANAFAGCTGLTPDTVRIVRGDADITSYLTIPALTGGGVDLTAVTVKPEYVKEPMDVTKGAAFDLSTPDAPQLTTAPTRAGLIYQLQEGETLEAMAADTAGDTKVGDGQPWTPTVKVKGGTSGFYTIRVSK